MAKGCRDCSRCTESQLTGCIMGPFRLLWYLTIIGPILQWGKRRCPQCGHPLAWHDRDKTGRFMD